MCGCSTHETVSKKSAPQTYIVTAADPQKALLLSQQYLEWNKGIDIQIHDPQRGMIVTTWTSASPNERYRVTLRATQDSQGTVLSSHTEYQLLEASDWKDLPSPSEWESHLLAELDAYIQARTNARAQ